MEIEWLSNTFKVRKLGKEDVERVYDLCYKNKIFYQFHPPLVPRESILEDMHALPPRNNPQSNAFWKKNGFLVRGENDYILMELVL